MFLYDLHTHTVEVSPCGVLTAEETIASYAAAGFTGICVTDHYNAKYFARQGDISWEEKICRYLSGWRAAVAAGARMGMDVLLGAEVRLPGADNEYLLYGLTPDFLYAHPMHECTVASLSALARAHGLLLCQAHPMRSGQALADPALLDGAEVYNGNPRHTSHNEQALALAKTHGLIMLSGSDSHEAGDAGLGGMLFHSRMADNAALLAALRSGDYALLMTPRKV